MTMILMFFSRRVRGKLLRDVGEIGVAIKMLNREISEVTYDILLLLDSERLFILPVFFFFFFGGNELAFNACHPVIARNGKSVSLLY